MAGAFSCATARVAGCAVFRYARSSHRRTRLAEGPPRGLHAPRDGNVYVGSVATGDAPSDRRTVSARVRVDARRAGATWSGRSRFGDAMRAGGGGVMSATATRGSKSGRVWFDLARA